MLTLEVCNDTALRSWILGWGASARVLAPPALARRHPHRSHKRQRAIPGLTCADPLRLVVLVVFALLFFGGPSMVRFYTDWLWFGEVGYQQVFTTIVRSEASLFTIAFVVSVIWLVVNLRLALGSVGEGRPIFTTQQGMEVALPGRQQLRTIASAIAMVLSALIGLVRLVAVGDVGNVAEGRALRPAGSDPRPRRLLLRASPSRSCSWCAASRRRWSS